MRVLVTGASGFLGHCIARQLLARGDQVVGLQRSDAPALRALGGECVRGDIADAQVVEHAAKGCDAIIHTAAKAGHWGSEAEYQAINVRGTQHVLAACLRLGIAKLVHTSTPSVVHQGHDLEGVDESIPYATRFLAAYPRTKAQAERLVLAANQRSLSTVALRPHLIWGPGDQHLLPRMEARARAGRLRFVGASKLIDTVYVENAADAHLLALDRLAPGASCAGKAYFIAQGEPIKLDEMVNALLDCVGLPPVNRRIAFPVAYGVGAVLEWVYRAFALSGEPIMTRFLAEHLATAHWYDLSAARRDLGYDPKISLAQGLRLLKASMA